MNRSHSNRRNSSNSRSSRPPRRYRRPNRNGAAGGAFIVERTPLPKSNTFRILLAIHRPRFRGRAQRAAALGDWDVVALQNKQDPVGIVQKPPRPPDILVISGDFGRQRSYGILRAVQSARLKGMKIVALVDDCSEAPEGYPDAIPSQLSDVCLTPPYLTTDLRAVFVKLYEEIKGEPAPPPRSSSLDDSEDLEEDEE